LLILGLRIWILLILGLRIWILLILGLRIWILLILGLRIWIFPTLLTYRKRKNEQSDKTCGKQIPASLIPTRLNSHTFVSSMPKFTIYYSYLI